MMSQTPYLKVARIVKTRALMGEVMAVSVDGLPFCLYEGLNVWIVPPVDNVPRQSSIVSISSESDSCSFISLDSIEDIDAAKNIVGCYLLVSRDDIDLDEYTSSNTFVDRKLIDERYGDLGLVTEYLETPANDVLLVNGQYGEILIPLIDDVIVELPQSCNLPIKTHIMDGLIKK